MTLSNCGQKKITKMKTPKNAKEKFAEFIYKESCKLIPEFEYILDSVMVKEHNSNGAIFLNLLIFYHLT